MITVELEKSSSVSWGNFFQIATVNLDSWQQNTSSHKLTVKPNAGERAPRICGDNDLPSYADRIKERTEA